VLSQWGEIMKSDDDSLERKVSQIVAAVAPSVPAAGQLPSFLDAEASAPKVPLESEESARFWVAPELSASHALSQVQSTYEGTPLSPGVVLLGGKHPYSQSTAPPVTIGVVETGHVKTGNEQVINKDSEDGVAHNGVSATSISDSAAAEPTQERPRENMSERRNNLKDLAKLANGGLASAGNTARNLRDVPSVFPEAPSSSRENSGMIDLNAALGMDAPAANSNAPHSVVSPKGEGPSSVSIPAAAAVPTMPSMPVSAPSSALGLAPLSGPPSSQMPASMPSNSLVPVAAQSVRDTLTSEAGPVAVASYAAPAMAPVQAKKSNAVLFGGVGLLALAAGAA
jgi:hypothetical protein